MSADWNITDELTRKSGDAYSWLDNEYQRGQMEPSAYYTALVALDLACLGLVPDEYSQWAVSKRRELAVQPDLGLVHVAAKNGTVAVVRKDDAPSVRVTIIGGTDRREQRYVFDDCVDPHKAAGQRYRAVIEKLRASGYEEV